MSKRNRLISWIIIILGVLYCLFACSPLQRLNRFQKKHPYLFEVKTDTMIHRDTIQVTVPGLQIDTAVHIGELIDTIIITQDHITTSVWMKNDTVYVNTKSDTVFVNVPYEVRIPYTKYVTKPPPELKWYQSLFRSFWFWLFLAALIYSFILQKKP